MEGVEKTPPVLQRDKKPSAYRVKGLNYHNFHIFIIISFKTDRYLNNFQDHLFGIQRLRKYQASLQNFFPT